MNTHLKEARYVVPRFDGEFDGVGARIRAVLDRFGAYNVRDVRAFGTVSFKLPANADWCVFLDALAEVHPECRAWSYSRLDRASCDIRWRRSVPVN